jgi:hypothetical protein
MKKNIIQEKMGNFERAYQSVFYKSARLFIVLGVGTLYTMLIQESVGGVWGWILGPLLTAGLEFGGMHAMSITVKEKTPFWFVMSGAYVVTHILNFVFIELLEERVGAEIILGISIIVSAILSYFSYGYENEKAEERLREEREEKKRKEDEKQDRLSKLQQEKDAIDLQHYKERRAEEARHERLQNKQERQSKKVQNPSPVLVQNGSQKSEIIPLSELPLEKRKEVMNVSWEKYRTISEQKHGPIGRTMYYEMKKADKAKSDD